MNKSIQSTIEEPLKFFSWLFQNDNFTSYKGTFFTQYENVPDVIYEEDKVSYWDVVPDNDNNPIEITRVVDFDKELYDKLRSELLISESYINKAIGKICLDGSSPERYLSLQLSIIREIAETTVSFYSHYIFIKQFLNTLETFLIERINRYSTDILLKKTTQIDDKNPTEENVHAHIQSLPEELPQLRSSFSSYKLKQLEKNLVKNNLIDSNPKFADILTGNSTENLINWKLDNKRLFYYFLKKLFRAHNRNSINWRIVERTFTFRGETIYPSFKSNNGNNNNDTEHIINSIIDILEN